MAPSSARGGPRPGDGEVQAGDVDPWLTQEGQYATVGGRRDELADLCLRQAGDPGDPGDLQVGVGGADVRVDPGAGRGHRVGRYGLGRDALPGGDRGPALLDLAEQLVGEPALVR